MERRSSQLFEHSEVNVPSFQHCFLRNALFIKETGMRTALVSQIKALKSTGTPGPPLDRNVGTRAVPGASQGWWGMCVCVCACIHGALPV